MTIKQGCAALRIPCFSVGVGLLSAAGGRRIRIGTPGTPDLFALLPDGRTLWIEAKSKRGTLRPDQVDFRNLCLARGVPHCVARSWEDVEQWVRR